MGGDHKQLKRYAKEILQHERSTIQVNPDHPSSSTTSWRALSVMSMKHHNVILTDGLVNNMISLAARWSTNNSIR
ncbi:unnamed protein product [Absidia cylindrospora]